MTRRQGRRQGWRWRRAIAVLVSATLAGCAVVTPLPEPESPHERLARMPTTGLPLAAPVTIHWNEHQVPYIVAASDDDGAFALGLVHAHLRLGQMAVYKRVARGRIAEMVGPLAVDIDHGIRLLGFGRAAARIEASLPAETRRWLQRFVDGINHYQDRVRPLPHEYDVLALEPEPWTIGDVLTFGRLAGTDVTWLVWFNLLKLRSRPDWPQIWARITRDGGAKDPLAAGVTDQPDALASVLASVARTGSNSLALAPHRTRTGGAILANDPHLGLNIPNTWLIAGLSTPTYRVVGLMIPGVPVFAIGRNPEIAWGGTNMRASASDLVDVAGLPEDEKTSRRETIAVRGWLDREIVLRETRFGPIISDAPQMAKLNTPEVSLRWTGHRASDELTAMLKVARAQSFPEFRAAFADFAVPGQNMLYADASGTIGTVLAVRVPDRSRAPADVILDPGEAEAVWAEQSTAFDLPARTNPEEGFLASANNRPEGAAVGYFFSPDDRVWRMAELARENAPLAMSDVEAVQQDVFVASSLRLRDVFVEKIRAAGLDDGLSDPARRVYERMAAWDGHYHAEAAGPVAFELFRAAFTKNFYQNLFGASDWAAFAGVGQIKALLIEDIATRDPRALAPMLTGSLERAGERIDDSATWGAMHRLVLQHPLALLPVIGGRYRFADHPVGGSSESLMKTAHGATLERHRASYGANARHISDLSDPDHNYFVLLGGQDGWLNSANFLDQVPLWREGRYLRMPLRPESIAAQFPHRQELSP